MDRPRVFTRVPPDADMSWATRINPFRGQGGTGTTVGIAVRSWNPVGLPNARRGERDEWRTWRFHFIRTIAVFDALFVISLGFVTWTRGPVSRAGRERTRVRVVARDDLARAPTRAAGSR